jgi:hypothetical protein
MVHTREDLDTGVWVAYFEVLDPTTRVTRRFYLARPGGGSWSDGTDDAARFTSEADAVRHLSGLGLGRTKVGAERL